MIAVLLVHGYDSDIVSRCTRYSTKKNSSNFCILHKLILDFLADFCFILDFLSNSYVIVIDSFGHFWEYLWA